MIVVSSCLAGIACRYDNKACTDETLVSMVKNGEALPICPECLGGLKTPRPCAEIRGGSGEDVLMGKARVIAKKSDEYVDVTDSFIKGAYLALEKAKRCGAEKAILKSKSPSCGAGCIYDGSFTGCKKAGFGVTAALFIQNGIEIETR